MTLPKHPFWTTLTVAFLILLAGCTIVREVDNGDDSNGDDDPPPIGAPPFDIPDDADVVDALVFVELSRADSEISSGYHSYLQEVQIALAVQHEIYVRDLAVAPLYRQHNHRPPLLYGRNAPNNLKSSLEQSLEYYLTDEGRGHLDERVDSPVENPAALGLELATEPIYNPEAGPGDASPYFGEPEDGFVVFHITASARECSHDDNDCTANGQSPADYFTTTNTEDEATWLNLPGANLDVAQIAHVAVATEEGVDYEDFADNCTGRVGFPGAYLDFLEPSSHHLFYQPMIADIDTAGGVADYVDMCEALSSALLDGSAIRTASTIAEIVR